jgi:hypothetical protein
MVSERDKGMRAAALSMLARLHAAVGAAATWSLLGPLSGQQRSLIEERFKHKERHAESSGPASTSYVSSWCAPLWRGAGHHCDMHPCITVQDPPSISCSHLAWTACDDWDMIIRAGWTSRQPATAAARAPPPAAAGRPRPTLRRPPSQPRPASQSGEAPAWALARSMELFWHP